jgi:uncharacterized protein YaaR (DUF327 family)
MKINDIDSGSSIFRTSGKEDKKIFKNRNSSFNESFGQAQQDNRDEHMKKALKEIDEKAEILKERIDMRDFIEFKNKVKDFLDYVVKNSHHYSLESKLSRGGSYQMFGIINKVNEEVEELAKEFLKDEKDKLKIIERISGIEGLLLDIGL